MRAVRTLVVAALALVMVQLGGPAAYAQSREIFTAGQPQDGTSLAIGGYDPVTYHSINQAVPGTGQFRVSWKGAEWRFSSLQNRDLFVANPERYAPQYGGWCAFALANGAKSPSEPTIFDVVGGRLYLNQSPGTQNSWRRARDSMILRGDQNWLRIAQQ